jgi:hypothetical protein
LTGIRACQFFLKSIDEKRNSYGSNKRRCIEIH